MVTVARIARCITHFTCALLSLAAALASAGTFTAHGPVTYERGEGPPQSVDGAFEVRDPTAPYRLELLNGWMDADVAGLSALPPGPGDVAPLGAPDGQVNVSDVLKTLRWAVGLDPADIESMQNADVAPNRPVEGGLMVLGDGVIDVADTIAVLRASVGFDPLLRITSAVVRLNGVVIFDESDFDATLERLERPVELQSSNDLDVELRGSPGSVLSLRVLGEDVVPPTILASVSPAPNANGWHSGPATVTYECDDATSGIASCPIAVLLAEDGESQTIDGIATDAAGNSTLVSLVVSIDQTPPSLIFMDPVEGQSLSAGESGVLMSAIDATSGIEGLHVNGVSAHSTTLGWEVSLTLLPGEQQLTATTSDRAGNSVARSIFVSVGEGDRLLPPVLDELPNVVSEPQLPVSGRAANADLVTVHAPSGVVDLPVVDHRFEGSVRLLPDQQNRLHFIGKSLDGRETAPTVAAVTFDQAPPSLFVDFPPDGAQVAGDSVSVSGRVSDHLSGFMGLGVEVDGVAADVAIGIGTNATFDRPRVPLTPGANLITVTARDYVGNVAHRSVTIYRVEPAGPHIELVSGDGQTARVRTDLDEPVAIRLSDATGLPIAGRLLTFEVVRSDGRLGVPGEEPTTTLLLQAFTDDRGEARVLWRTGSDAGCGNNRLVVRSAGVAGQVFVSASAEAAPPSQVNVGTGDSQRVEVRAVAPEPLRVWVNDSCNGIADVPVTFRVITGAGLVDGSVEATVATSPTGHAEVTFRLGRKSGAQIVEADFPGNPGAPATFTLQGVSRVLGQGTSFETVVLSNGGQPIGGAPARLSVAGETHEGASDVTGVIRFDGIPAGPARLEVAGALGTAVGGVAVPHGSFPSLAFDLVIVPDAANTLPSPVKLPSLDPANARLYDGTEDVLLSVADIGGLRMTIQAGSMTLADGTRPSPANPAVVSLNQVHHDDIPMPMPDGVAPALAWTLQPGGATFDPPVSIEYPNAAGLAPGAAAYFLSFDHDTHRFEIVAPGRVTRDGDLIQTEPNVGIVEAGWGCACPPYAPTASCQNTASVAVVLFKGGPDCVDSSAGGALKELGAAIRRAVPSAQTHLIDSASRQERQIADANSDLQRTRGPNQDSPVMLVGHSLGGDTVVLDSSIPSARAFAIDPISRELTIGDSTCFPNLSCIANQRLFTRGTARTNITNLLAAPLNELEAAACFSLPLTCSAALTQCGRGYKIVRPAPLPPASEYNIELPMTDHTSVVVAATDRVVAAVRELANEPARLQDEHGTDDVLTANYLLSIGGQAASVESSGFFGIGNVPAIDRFGVDGEASPPDGESDDAYRITGVAMLDGAPMFVHSEPFRVQAGGTVVVDSLTFSREPPPIPIGVSSSLTRGVLFPGEQAGLRVMGRLPDGRLVDVTSDWTTHRSSNPGIATVDARGRVTAVSRGPVVLTSTHFGATSSIELSVVVIEDTTTVIGRVADSTRTPLVGVEARVLGQAAAAVTDADGRFSIERVLVDRGPLVVAVHLPRTAGTLVGLSEPRRGLVEAITDVGLVSTNTICEHLAGTECIDTDGDCVPDAIEVEVGRDPETFDDPLADPDGDGLSTCVEMLSSSDAFVRRDTDLDGLSDLEEVLHGSDPLSSDTDADGLSDLEEVALGTPPTVPDADAPMVQLFGPGRDDVLIEGRRVRFDASAADDGRVESVEILVDGVPIASGNESPMAREFLLPSGVTEITVQARALDTAGNVGVSDAVVVVIQPSTTTTVVGRVVDSTGVPLADARVFIGSGYETVSEADGSFALREVPDNLLNPTAHAHGLLEDKRLGISKSLSLEHGGVTGVGDLVLNVLHSPSFHGVSFGSPSTFAEQLVDVNADGLPDLLYFRAERFSRVVRFEWREGKLDGWFGEVAPLASARVPGLGRSSFRIAADDLNSDGHLDFVCLDVETGTAYLLLSNPAGEFEIGQGFILGPVHQRRGPLVTMVSIGDFNGDGTLDIAAADTLGVVRMARGIGIHGIGSGRVEESVRFELDGNVPTLLARDLDGDGSMNLIALDTSSSSIHVLFGSTEDEGPTRIPVGREPMAVAAADMNGDGLTDIVVGTRPAGIQVVTQLSQGRWEVEPWLDIDPDDTYEQRLSCLTVGDLDGDGSPDVVAMSELNYGRTTRPGLLWAGLGGAGGAFSTAVAQEVDGLAQWCGLRDVDGDAVPDLVRGHLGHVARGAGDGSFLGPIVTRGAPQVQTAGDFNGDGWLDVVGVSNGYQGAAFPAGGGVVLLGRGDGSFSAAPSFDLDSESNSRPVAADVDNDGLADLLVLSHSRDEVLVFGGSPSGQLEARSALAVPQPSFLLPADFDADGQVDYLVYSRGLGEFVLHHGQGDGTFVPGAGIALPIVNHALSTDVNGDGLLDVVALVRSGFNSAQIVSLLGDGLGGFTLAWTSVSVGSADLVGAADVDGDGVTDLVYSNNSLSVLLGVGDGRFIQGPWLSLPPFPSSTELLDFTGDGIADVLGTVPLQGLEGGAFRELGFQLRGGLIRVGDFDGDGLPDAYGTPASGGPDSSTTGGVMVFLHETP